MSWRCNFRRIYSNTVVAGCYEVWRPVGQDESLTDASLKALKNSLNDAVTMENGVKGVAKKAAEEIVKKTGRVALWPAFLAKDIFDCLSNTVRGIKDYVNGNFDKQEKELVKVTSWDPNAKEGPSGYGAEGFISSTATMSYTIFFENKKEATAPAYQIVILDTLEQNYPNPFNPVTRIKFSIPKRTRVELSVYNILGEKVSEIINSEIEAGKYEYEFNAVNLSSGVYFYRLKTDDYISVKKMILIK